MYGILHGDGTVQRLEAVSSAAIEGDELICRDPYDRVVARFVARDSMFGRIEALRRLAPYLKQRLRTSDELQEAF
jgi:hypothetical protein